MIKNAFHSTLKALFVLSCDVFGYVEKHLDKKAQFNFKTSDFASWETNNYNRHMA